MKPIIFIPGIEATNLVDANSFGFDTVWNAYDNFGASLKTTILGAYLSAEEALQYEPLYDVSPQRIVERANVARLPYEQTFINLNNKLNTGKQTPDPIYMFGYDWRLSNAENGKRLLAFTDYLKQKLKQYQVTSFRFVTHSMGCLVLSSFLSVVPDYRIVDKVIFCAPPFLGSPYALIHMVKGNGGFKSFLNKVFGHNDDIRKVVRTFPSIFELLACYPNWINYYDDSAPLNLLDINSWQSNVYDDIKDLFTSRLKSLAAYRWQNMKDLGTLPADVRQRMLIVAGTGDDTLTNIFVDKQNGDIKNMIRLDLVADGMGTGDGTVPEVSAICYKDSIKTLSIKKDSLLAELGDNIDYHGMFMRDSRVQNIIYHFFQNDTPAANILQNQLTRNPDADTIWYSIGGTIINRSAF